MDINKIIEEIYSEFYELSRRGAFDFPDEKIWLKDKVKLFRRNHPELLGYIYDEKTNDWIKEQEECQCGLYKFGNYSRMPNNKKI